MSLKYKIAKLEEVPEAVRSLYAAQSDGTYVLQVEGAVDKSKIDEFRNTNIDLSKRLESFKDVDVEKYRAGIELQKQLDEKKLIDAGQFDKVIEQRVAEMKKNFDQVQADLTEKLSKSNRQLEVLIVDNEVRTAATKVGILPSAVDDVLLRAKQIYKVDAGAAVPKNEKGETIFGKDGTNPMPITEWIGGLKETAVHLFQPSQGGGAGGGGPGKGVVQTANMSPTQKIAAGLNAQNQ